MGSKANDVSLLGYRDDRRIHLPGHSPYALDWLGWNACYCSRGYSSLAFLQSESREMARPWGRESGRLRDHG
jgi:hypothetical protein